MVLQALPFQIITSMNTGMYYITTLDRHRPGILLLINARKKVGPKAEPRGTPALRSYLAEDWSSK